VGAVVVQDLEQCVQKYGSRHGNSSRALREKDANGGTAPKQQNGAKKRKRKAPTIDKAAKVMLIIDKRELTRKKGKLMQAELEKLGVCFSGRTLDLADMMWVVKNPNGMEIAMSHGIERKTISDLSDSIKGSRYREQKFRLAKCELSHVVYVIEGSLSGYSGKSRQYLLPKKALDQAVLSTSYGSSSFVVHKTSNVKDTALYLHRYTKMLQQLVNRGLAQSHVLACGLETFNRHNKKTQQQRVMDTFAQQLMQLPLVSGNKVTAIVQQYPCSADLIDAYDECETKKQKKDMLKDIVILGSTRKLGPKLSEAVAKAYAKKQ